MLGFPLIVIVRKDIAMRGKQLAACLIKVPKNPVAM